MHKINRAAIIFSFILIASLGFTGNVRANIIDTLNISIQNPATPPAPPKKPEPPLPPNIPTSTPKTTPVATGAPTTTNNGGSSGNDGGDGLGCATHDCSGNYVAPPQGQVLGASTMAKTGGFAEVFYQAIMGVGATLTAFGTKGLKKGKKASK